MKINKIINNNVVSVINEQNKELVIMGKGIGFKKKIGDDVDKSNIEKIFTLENQELAERFHHLLSEIPIQFMEVSEEIIKYSNHKLNKKLNESIFIALTDHIHFAVERHHEGIEIKNGLLWEIKKLYKEEYLVGLKGLEIIKEKLNVSLSEDEAGFIAMHILNAEMNEEMPNIMKITNLIQEILNIVKYNFNVDFDEESLNYFRFITHLKFFGQRLFSNSISNSKDDFLFEMVKEKYKSSFQCSEKIKGFIQKKYDYDLNNEEMMYLTIHIERVVNR